MKRAKPWNEHLDEIFWSRTSLEVAAKDIVQVQKKLAGKLHPRKEFLTVPTLFTNNKISQPTTPLITISHALSPTKILFQSLNHKEKNEIYFFLKRGIYFDKSCPLKNVGVITNKLNIWICWFFSLHFFVLLKKPCPWCLLSTIGVTGGQKAKTKNKRAQVFNFTQPLKDAPHNWMRTNEYRRFRTRCYSSKLYPFFPKVHQKEKHAE